MFIIDYQKIKEKLYNSTKKIEILFRISLAILTAILIYYFYYINDLENHYQCDFSGYYAAAKLINEGEDPYINRAEFNDDRKFEHSQYLQNPIVIQFFRIFGTFNYHQAKTFWFIIESLLIVGIIGLLIRRTTNLIITYGLLLITLPILFWPLYSHFERGQTDVVVLFFIVISYLLWCRGRSAIAGITLALGCVFKIPAFFIFSVPLIKGDKKFLIGGGVFLLFLLVFSVIINGDEINKKYFFDYLPTIGATGNLPSEVYNRNIYNKLDVSANLNTPYYFDGMIYETVSLKLNISTGSFSRFSNRLIAGIGWKVGIFGFLISFMSIFIFLHHRDSIISKDLAWAFAMVATLLFHPMTHVMNYVWIIFIFKLIISVIIRGNKHINNYTIRALYILLFVAFLIIGMSDGVKNQLISLIDFLLNGLIPSFDIDKLHYLLNYWMQERIWIGGLIIYFTLLFMMKYFHHIFPSDNENKMI